MHVLWIWIPSAAVTGNWKIIHKKGSNGTAYFQFLLLYIFNGYGISDHILKCDHSRKLEGNETSVKPAEFKVRSSNTLFLEELCESQLYVSTQPKELLSFQCWDLYRILSLFAVGLWYATTILEEPLCRLDCFWHLMIVNVASICKELTMLWFFEFDVPFPKAL